MITWECHICKEERPDAAISVLSKPLDFGDGPVGTQNIRYCNDRPACSSAAREFSLFKAPESKRGGRQA